MKTRRATQFTEPFRKALIREHPEWSMETIAEAAYICGEVAEPTLKLMPNDTPEAARRRYRSNGFGVHGSPSAKKTFDRYMSLFEETS